MAEKNADLERLMAELKHQRDEIELKLHLAKTEARTQWSEIEKKWEQLRGKMKVVEKEAGGAAEDIAAAARLLGEEIRKGYERLRKVL